MGYVKFELLLYSMNLHEPSMEFILQASRWAKGTHVTRSSKSSWRAAGQSQSGLGGLAVSCAWKKRELEEILLRLCQSHHTLNELLVWIERTDSTLDELKTVSGDQMVIEVELAKLKVVVNDIQAHQTSVDALNEAGNQSEENASDSEVRQRLELWNCNKATHRQHDLEDALKEALKRTFSAQVQDLMQWLNDINGSLSASKPVGGLSKTASEQLQGFIATFNELEQSRPKIEGILQQGSDYLERSTNESLSSRLRSLRRWSRTRWSKYSCQFTWTTRPVRRGVVEAYCTDQRSLLGALRFIREPNWISEGRRTHFSGKKNPLEIPLRLVQVVQARAFGMQVVRAFREQHPVLFQFNWMAQPAGTNRWFFSKYVLSRSTFNTSSKKNNAQNLNSQFSFFIFHFRTLLQGANCIRIGQS